MDNFKADYEQFFNMHLDLLCIANFEGYFLTINAAWEPTLGYTMEDLTNVQFLSFIHPDDVQPTLNVMAEMGEGKTLINFINRYRHKDGSYRYFEWRAAPAQGVIYASARDITQYKETQEAMRQSQMRMQAIIDSQTNYVLRTDIQGNYTYANSKYIEDFGWIHGGAEHIIGSNCLPAISAHHHALIEQTVKKCLAKPNVTVQVEMDKPLQNNKIANTLWDFVCLTDAEGNPSEIQCLGINITDRKRAESEVREREQSAMIEMSTPITQLWEGILLLPLVGLMTAKRAQTVLMAVLRKISETQAKVFILDITGVGVVDTEVANHFIKLAKATRLMGCTCTISGISPAVSQTIVELGVQVEEFNTTGTMKVALEQALVLTGFKLVSIG